MSSDPQSDRVIDRLLAEREKAEARAKGMALESQREEIEETKKSLPPSVRRDPAIVELVEREGKIPEEFLSELVGVKLREGL